MRLAAFCCVLCLTACMPMKAPDTHDADVKAIKDVESAWVKTAATKDVDAFVAYYADDGSVLMPNAPLFTGKPAIKEQVIHFVKNDGFIIHAIAVSGDTDGEVHGEHMRG